MAKENFLEQVGGLSSKIACVSSVSELENSKDAQVIILESGNEGLFLESLQILSDMHERVVLIKNIEVFSEPVFTVSLPFEQIILSGNIDECIAKESILQKTYKTMITFNQPQIQLPFVVPQLEKYTGYLSSRDMSGIITIQK